MVCMGEGGILVGGSITDACHPRESEETGVAPAKAGVQNYFLSRLRRRIYDAGGSPAAGYFLCVPKESSQRKGTPKTPTSPSASRLGRARQTACPYAGWLVRASLRALLNTRAIPPSAAMLGGVYGVVSKTFSGLGLTQGTESTNYTSLSLGLYGETEI